MTNAHYYRQRAQDVLHAIGENGPLTFAGLKRKTKLSDIELSGALGWLAREGSVHITGEIPLLFTYSMKEKQKTSFPGEGKKLFG